ncbi:hypothetical protein OHB26_24715 [Nocardia sp. NBC_01503]|uniref:hypothetical protein n=1 Tax=Nocardia sp. NBC_01503 TaxID=2975997 RepID=UPI002E7AFDBE|nr:hypothetical protein [Nocardia sp. NBC_01503]WTL30143.1 hypothetical protein OHB26_24715 [Nocardia sp. NBC_01503]
MTDYLRPIAAYVASQSGHRQPTGDRPGQPAAQRTDTPDSKADTAIHADSAEDKGWTR